MVRKWSSTNRAAPSALPGWQVAAGKEDALWQAGLEYANQLPPRSQRWITLSPGAAGSQLSTLVKRVHKIFPEVSAQRWATAAGRCASHARDSTTAGYSLLFVLWHVAEHGRVPDHFPTTILEGSDGGTNAGVDADADADADADVGAVAGEAPTLGAASPPDAGPMMTSALSLEAKLQAAVSEHRYADAAKLQTEIAAVKSSAGQPSSAMSTLEAQLATAVEAQDYSTAADLQFRITKLTDQEALGQLQHAGTPVSAMSMKQANEYLALAASTGDSAGCAAASARILTLRSKPPKTKTSVASQVEQLRERIKVATAAEDWVSVSALMAAMPPAPTGGLTRLPTQSTSDGLTMAQLLATLSGSTAAADAMDVSAAPTLEGAVATADEMFESTDVPKDQLQKILRRSKIRNGVRGVPISGGVPEFHHPAFSSRAGLRLAALVKSDFQHGLATGTRRSYQKGVRRLARFGLQMGLVADGCLLPPDELTLMFWATSMVHIEKLSVGYVSTLMTGIQNAFVEWGMPSPLRDVRTGSPLPLLHRHLRGLKRQFAKPRRERLPITTVILKLLMARLTSGLPGVLGTNFLVYRAMLSLGVYALLRQGEMTAETTKEWDPRRQAARSSVTFGRTDVGGPIDHMVFHCVASKVDPFRNSCRITVHSTGPPDCPVAAMKAYLDSRPPSDGLTPLFVHTDGSYVTRGRLASCLQSLLTQCGFAQTKYSTHSLRIGGCVSLSAAGYGREVIAVYGRWASNALELYLRLDRSMLRQASLGMAHIGPDDIQTRGQNGIRRGQ